MTEKMHRLSDRQRRILAFIQEHVRVIGYPPSMREIGKATKITSTAVTQYNLNILEREGFIERDQGVARGLRLTA